MNFVTALDDIVVEVGGGFGLDIVLRDTGIEQSELALVVTLERIRHHPFSLCNSKVPHRRLRRRPLQWMRIPEAVEHFVAPVSLSQVRRPVSTTPSIPAMKTRCLPYRPTSWEIVRSIYICNGSRPFVTGRPPTFLEVDSCCRV
jgi:hypothetical protein